METMFHVCRGSFVTCAQCRSRRVDRRSTIFDQIAAILRSAERTSNCDLHAAAAGRTSTSATRHVRRPDRAAGAARFAILRR